MPIYYHFPKLYKIQYSVTGMDIVQLDSVCVCSFWAVTGKSGYSDVRTMKRCSLFTLQREHRHIISKRTDVACLQSHVRFPIILLSINFDEFM